MPLISTLGSAGAQSFGNRGLRYGGSAFFNAAGDYLVVPISSAFTHTGNFTIEMWIYPTTISGIQLLWRQDQRVLMYLTGGQVLWWHGSTPYPVSAIAVTVNAWNHIAVVRNSGVLTIYVNGVGSGSVFNLNTVTTGINPLIGTYDGFNYQYLGYLTNLRVAKQALYTSNFAPSGLPFTVTSQGSTTTQLLLNTRSSSTLVTDSSANNFSLTNVNVTYADFTPFLQPYVTPGVVVIQSATVTPSTFTPSEGTTITFNIVGTNTPNGTYYYTIEEDIATGAITGADFTSGVLSGTFSISGSTGSFPLTVTRDLFTEGTEEFNVYVRKDSTSGTILGTSGNITIADTSLTPVFTATPASINEGGSGTFTVANVGPDGTYFWVMFNNTSSNSDFSAASGSFLVSGSTGGIDNGTGSFSVTAIKDLLTEGSENFQVQVRSGSTSGPGIVTSNFVTIVDVSLTPSVTPASNNMSEGQSLSFTAENLGPNGTYFWSINHGTTASADFSAENGSFSITGGGAQDNGTGTFSVTALNDFVTEGSQSFTVSVRSGSISGPILATTSSVTINDTSTTVTASGLPSSVSEGSDMIISVSAGSFPNGTYFWTILNGTTTDADFTAASGSFTVSNGVSGAFTVTPATLDGAEGTEFFQVQIRTGSTSGPVIATTGSLTINLSAT
jgi:hypothetical protein